jgi:hypothetical protein
MTNGAEIKPTLETILARINALGEDLRAFREEVGIRLDRVESMTNQTRAEMLTLRADFKELRSALREHLPALR